MKKKLLILLVGLSMVGCEAKNEEVAEEPKEAPVKIEEPVVEEPETITVYKEGEIVEAEVIDGCDYEVMIENERWNLLTKEDLGYDPFERVCEVCGLIDSDYEDEGHRYCMQHLLQASGCDDTDWTGNRYTKKLNPKAANRREISAAAEKVVYKIEK